MRSETYRIKDPCLAIVLKLHGKRVSVTIPDGAEVTVVNGPLDGTGMVEVEWEGDIILMFTADLRTSGTLVGDDHGHVRQLV
jgi:hypothetical protein